MDGIFVEHGDGEFLSYSTDNFKVQNGNWVILPPLKLRAQSLCQEIPLIWRKDRALNELLTKKKIPPEMVDDLHKNFVGALNQLKNDAKNVMSNIDSQINRCNSQIQELHSALINLEIEREIGRINNEAYQKALQMVQWGLKGVNAEKSDLSTLKSKLNNLLLGEITKPPEKPTPTESPQKEQAVPPQTDLPEPPVIVHVKNENR